MPGNPLQLHIRRVRRLICVSLLATACGGNAEPATPAAMAKPAPVVPEEPKPPAGSVWREDVNETIDEGLGYFLQRVEVDPEVRGGRFEGFRIVSLIPEEYWDGIDLRPGDVVTGINGMPIERETEAYAAFQALRTADAIRVEYLRGGQPRQLVVGIVDKPGAKRREPAPKSAPKGVPSVGPSDSPPPPAVDAAVPSAADQPAKG